MSKFNILFTSLILTIIFPTLKAEVLHINSLDTCVIDFSFDGNKTICEGDTLQIASPIIADTLQYTWSTGDTVDAIQVSSAGIYYLTVNSASCSGVDSVVVDLLPKPLIQSVNSTRVCLGAETAFSRQVSADTDAIFSWTFSDGSTLNSVDSIIYYAFSSWSDSLFASLVVTNPNGCTDSLTIPVFVDTIPVVSSFGADTVYCENEPPTQFTGIPAGGYFIGLGVDSLGMYTPMAGNDIIINYYYTDINGCTGVSSQLIDTVYPIPVIVINGLNDVTCLGDTLNLSANINGDFNINGLDTAIFFPSDTGQILINFTHTTADGCIVTIIDTTIVSPLPTVLYSGLDSIYCLGNFPDSLFVNLSGGLFSSSNITYAPNSSVALFRPLHVGLNEIRYDYTDINGCRNSFIDSTLVLGNGPTLNINIADSICLGSTLSVLNNSTGPIISYAWSSNAPNFIAISDTSNINPSIHFSDDTPSGEYTIRVSVSNSVCNPISVSFPIYVNQAPTATLADIPDFCEEASFTPTASFNVQPNFIRNITWSFPGSASPGSSLPNPGNIVYNTPGNYTLQVMVENECGQQTDSVQFLILQGPNPNFTLPDSICVGSPTTVINSSTGDWLTYDWTASSPSATIFSDPFIGNPDLNFPVNTPSGIYQLQVTVSSPVCPSVTNSFPVYVNRAPLVDLSAIPDVCESLSLTPNATFNISNNFIRQVQWSFPGGIPSQSSAFSPSNILYPGSGNYTVTLMVFNECGMDSTSQNFTIFSIPQLTMSGLATQYCAGDSPDTLSINIAGATVSGPLVQTLGNGITTFNPTQAGNYQISVSFTDTNGCSNTISRNTQVNALPSLTLEGLAAAYCQFDPPATLISNVAGQISGSNLEIIDDTRSQFTPNELGNFVITLSYTDANGCSSSVNRQTVVNPLPSVSFTGLADAYCTQDERDTLTGNQIGGIFSGINTTNVSNSARGVFNPLVQGTMTITYEYTDNNGCRNQQSKVTVVHPLPSLSVSGLQTAYCQFDPPVTLLANVTGGHFTGPNLDTMPGSNQAIYEPITLGLNQFSFRYTDSNGCKDTIYLQTFVNELPVVNFGSDSIALASGQSIVLSAGLSNPSISYLWSTGATTPDISVENPGFYILTATINATGCNSSDTIEVYLASNLHHTLPAFTEFKVFPNPATDVIVLSLKPTQTGIFPIRMFDAQGKIVYQGVISMVESLEERYEINISSLSPGVYLIHIGSETIKIIIKS